MANYIKIRLEELKADGIICTKKEKNPRTDWLKIQELEYLLQTYYHMWIGLIRWNTNSKEWLESGFNKLNGNEIDPTITELIKNFNSALTRGLKDRYWEEIHMKALRFRI